MAQALITGEVLRWARIRAGVSVESVAEKLNVPSGDISAWEESRSLPSFAKARDVAKFLKIPFGYLFLEKPPAESIEIPDLRRLGGEPFGQFSPDFREVYLDALAKQGWYREYLIQQGAENLPFVGSKRLGDDPTVVADEMRTALGVTRDWRQQTAGWDGMLRGLVAKAEAAGVLVLRNSVVRNNTRRPLSVKEFRGFALCDRIAPLVFINSADAPAAQIFSLAHELVHIWLDVSAISDFHVSRTLEGYAPLEIYCNKVAAEFLVPRREFEDYWRSDLSLHDNAASLSREFRVSKLVIVRRALDLGRISPRDYDRFYELVEGERTEAPREKKKAGGDFYALVRARNSPTFARAVVTEALEGRLLFRDAGEMLSIKPGKIKELAKYLGG